MKAAVAMLFVLAGCSHVRLQWLAPATPDASFIGECAIWDRPNQTLTVTSFAACRRIHIRLREQAIQEGRDPGPPPEETPCN